MKSITYSTALLLLICASAASGADSYDPATKQQIVPSLTIGLATYANVVVTIGRLISGPTGASAKGAEDSYDPGNRHLTVQTITVGAATFDSAVVTVDGLVSIGSVTGADTYNGSTLEIAYADVGGTLYENVVVSVRAVIGVAGGMPTR